MNFSQIKVKKIWVKLHFYLVSFLETDTKIFSLEIILITIPISEDIQIKSIIIININFAKICIIDNLNDAEALVPVNCIFKFPEPSKRSSI